MISGIFHQGSGLGDQLFRYITVRTLAEDKGYDFGFTWLSTGEAPKGRGFKGEDFMDIDYGSAVVGGIERTLWQEKCVRDSDGVDVRSYDPEINFVEDNTVIDGSFEDDKYWRHKLPEIGEWLQVEPLEVPDDICVIGFRGGEYYSDPNLGLPLEYFTTAMQKMREINPNMLFEVHTDDPEMAQRFLPSVRIIENTKISHSKHSNMGYNWRAMRYARYAIIANSSFYILPRILKHNSDTYFKYRVGWEEPITIAPRFWARRNTSTWARPACYYPEFTYV